VVVGEHFDKLIIGQLPPFAQVKKDIEGFLP